MKKVITILFLLFLLTLSACDEPVDDSPRTVDKTTNEEVIGDDESNEETNQEEYIKDGDIIKYFKTFGTEKDCSDLWGSENALCYEIDFSNDGIDITMRYYDIEGSYYETFDFVAKKNTASLVIQMDYQVRHDTSVVFSDGNQYIDGFLKYNGLDQTNPFDLNKTYEYEDWGNNSEESMQALLNLMILNVESYYQENIEASIVTVVE